MSRIVQLTDTHIVAPGKKAYGVVDTAAALGKAVEHIKRLSAFTDTIDAVILTGDLTDHGTPEEYAHLNALLAPLEIPLFAVPGNHDRRAPMRSAFAEILPEDGPLNWHLPLRDFDVLGLDSLSEGNPHGVLSIETLGWLSDRLKALAGRPVIVALHHPPFDTGLVDMDRQKLSDPDALLDILHSHARPIQIICGHVHRHITTWLHGMPTMIAPAPAHAVSFDQRGDQPATLMFEPPAVLIHEWRQQGNTGGFVSHAIPIGSFDGPYPFEDT